MSDPYLMDYPFRNKPFLHQRAYLERFWNKDKAALFADMGTGKSFMLINNIAMLYDQGKINGAVIVAPKGVYRNWTGIEIPKHMPEHVRFHMAIWSPTPRKAEEESLDKLFDITDDLKIFVINIEAFSTDKGTKFCNRFVLAHDTFMAIDESTTIKSPQARRSKNVLKVGGLAKVKRIATGSPVTKSPLDLFQQCAFLGYDCLGFSSYYAFQARYAKTIERNLATHSFKQIVGYQRIDELQEKLVKFSFRVRKEECFDLPDKTFVRREVELTEEQARAYKQMTLMALATFEKGITSTVNALTQIMRLQQIVCGHITLDTGEIVSLKNNRLDELLATVEEIDGKIIIWAYFRHDIEAIRLALQKVYGMNAVATYFGDTEAKDREEIVNRFQDESSELRFFVGQPRTGGYGLTLTAASTMIYYSNGYDLEVRLQSEARIDRYGQTKKMTYIDLIAPKTVDEKIVEALRKKINIANEVMGEELKAWLI